MLGGDRVIDAVRAQGATLITGVPCSFLSPVIDAAISHPSARYAGATSEGEATAIAAGAWLAGGFGVVLSQNAGLGNMINPLVSLAHPSRIPLLIFCTWRGEPGRPDEPQHELMGRAMLPLLDVVEVPHARLAAAAEELDDALAAAWTVMQSRRLPFCFVVSEGTVAAGPLDEPAPADPPVGEVIRLGGARRLTRIGLLERLLAFVPPEAALIATTGKTGRELFTLADREQHFYQVGAMGCASALGLGAALHTSRPVVALDGDGAALMKLGNFATIGVQAPPNLTHVLLDNGVHDSTGGQRTAASMVRFPDIARACGYRRVVSCDALPDFEAAMRQSFAEPGPHLVHVTLSPGSLPQLRRPDIHPREVAGRFRAFMTAGASPAVALPQAVAA
jgi:phosphonopyruvate decarboxylase